MADRKWACCHHCCHRKGLYDDAHEDPCPEPVAGRTCQPTLTEEAQRQVEEGRRLASEREDLIVGGAHPADLAIPLHPEDA